MTSCIASHRNTNLPKILLTLFADRQFLLFALALSGKRTSGSPLNINPISVPLCIVHSKVNIRISAQSFGSSMRVNNRFDCRQGDSLSLSGQQLICSSWNNRAIYPLSFFKIITTFPKIDMHLDDEAKLTVHENLKIKKLLIFSQLPSTLITFFFCLYSLSQMQKERNNIHAFNRILSSTWFSERERENRSLLYQISNLVVAFSWKTKFGDSEAQNGVVFGLVHLSFITPRLSR